MARRYCGRAPDTRSFDGTRMSGDECIKTDLGERYLKFRCSPLSRALSTSSPSNMSPSSASSSRLLLAILAGGLFTAAQGFTPLVDKRFTYPGGIVCTQIPTTYHSASYDAFRSHTKWIRTTSIGAGRPVTIGVIRLQITRARSVRRRLSIQLMVSRRISLAPRVIMCD